MKNQCGDKVADRSIDTLAWYGWEWLSSRRGHFAPGERAPVLTVRYVLCLISEPVVPKRNIMKIFVFFVASGSKMCPIQSDTNINFCQRFGKQCDQIELTAYLRTPH
jgi:hypothetical protein